MKTASIVFFYFGDSPFVSLAQETVPVGMALEGYDRSVLLHFDTKIGPFDVSKGDEKHATVVDKPTTANLAAQLSDLKKGKYIVDLFLFAHGGLKTFRTSSGVAGENDTTSIGQIKDLVKPLNINAVWQCNCWGSSWNSTWRKLGAKVSAGTRSVNFYPSRFGSFMRSWRDGKTFGEAVAESGGEAVRKASQAWILGQAIAKKREWGGTVFDSMMVLGENKAAERYFRTCWLGDDWVSGKAGSENMNIASEMIIDGDAGTLQTR